MRSVLLETVQWLAVAFARFPASGHIIFGLCAFLFTAFQGVLVRIGGAHEKNI